MNSLQFSDVVTWPRTPLLLRFAYGRKNKSTLSSPSRLRMHLSYALIAAIPLLGLLAYCWNPGEECATFNLVLLFDYCVLNYAQLLFATFTWEKLRSSSSSIDELISTADYNPRRDFLLMIEGMLSVRRQLMVVVIGPFVGALNAWLLIRSSAGQIGRCVATDLVAVFTGLIAVHSAYWIVCGAVLYYNGVRLPKLAITWNAPINTPGLVALSEVAKMAARLGFILFLLTQLPLTWAYLIAPTPPMSVIYYTALFLTAGFVTVFGLVVQSQLSQRVCDEKRAILDDLAHRIRIAGGKLSSARLGSVSYIPALFILKSEIDIYHSVDRSSSSYINTATIAQYGASLGAVILQLVLAVILTVR